MDGEEDLRPWPVPELFDRGGCCSGSVVPGAPILLPLEEALGLPPTFLDAEDGGEPTEAVAAADADGGTLFAPPSC